MLGVDSTCAFDLGQILPHSLWLSCQHPPQPRAAGPDRQQTWEEERPSALLPGRSAFSSQP